MKIAFIADLHFDVNNIPQDYAINFLAKIMEEKNIDKLFIGGDTYNNINHTIKVVDTANSILNNRQIYFVLGNHEFWTNKVDYNFADVFDNPNYIHNKAIEVSDDTVVIGTNGWFDYTFITDSDYSYDMPSDPEELESFGNMYFDLAKIGDTGIDHIDMAQRYINQTEELIKEHKDKKIILIQHFVAHEDFLTYKDYIWNVSNAFMGTKLTAELAERNNVDTIFFGHTHNRSGTKTINGVKYVCKPLGYRKYDNTWEGTFDEEFEKCLTIIDL